MGVMVKINVVGGGEKLVPVGTSLFELAGEYKQVCQHDILIAKVNNDLQELHKKITEDCDIEFLDVSNPHGFRVYQRSAAFLMIYAAKAVLGKKTRVVIEHSINKNYYCEIIADGVTVTDELLLEIEAKMREAVEKDYKIEKHIFPLDEGFKIADEFGLCDKIKILKYRRTSNVNFYKLDWLYDYFYGQMAYNTGRIPSFSLIREGSGFMLCFPAVKNGEMPISHDSGNYTKITEVFRESNKWAKILNAETVGALNDIITGGNCGQFIRVNEALHEKSIAQIADAIYERKNRIVLIAGPSSSGKTTFAERLSIQLRVNGLTPNVISLDNYYRNRSDIPIEADGRPDFEALGALDVDKINADLLSLLNGETVELPTFNFLSGKREYKGKALTLNSGDILVVEGIHGLNGELTEKIPDKEKFKVFISALTQLNIDDHNRISTTDSRLIRRIVRDSRFRGFDALQTIDIWASVMRGEEKYIFPYQEEADAFFNSALVYEMCVLKQYAEPLLFEIGKENPQYTDARRLVKFLDSFLSISSEEVPKNSILREFIGGSCFRT